MSRARPQRGWAILGALAITAAMTTLVAVGFGARHRDLSFEARTLQRTQARWAAESGIARALGRSGARALKGRLPSTKECTKVAYQVRRTGQDITATGRCIPPKGPDRTVTIVAAVARGRVQSWRERPTSPR